MGLQKLRARHREIIRLSFLGLKQREIAKRLGVSESFIYNVLSSPLSRDHLEMMQQVQDAEVLEIKRRIATIAPKAVEMLNEILMTQDATYSVKLQAAKDILDRAGYSPVRKLDSRHLHSYLTKEDLDELREKAVLAAIQAGVLHRATDSEWTDPPSDDGNGSSDCDD